MLERMTVVGGQIVNIGSNKFPFVYFVFKIPIILGANDVYQCKTYSITGRAG
jgi:hypothetical protein